MGECQYYLRVEFDKPLTARQNKAIWTFFGQAAKAELEDGLPSAKKYPALQHEIIKENWENIRVNGQVGVEDTLHCDKGDTVIWYINEVSHMADWSILCKIMEEVFGAKKATCTDEENSNLAELLDLTAQNEKLEEDKDIVDALLNRDPKELPTFLGIHPALDARIAKVLSKPARRKK